tara:strand:- start:572 stop:844 length:273 start_codon:yes stop_codon:yes gene_type:complete
MKRILIALLLISSLTLTACAVNYEGVSYGNDMIICEDDSGCKEGYNCVEGDCISLECETEQDCIGLGECAEGLECTCFEGECYTGFIQVN